MVTIGWTNGLAANRLSGDAEGVEISPGATSYVASSGRGVVDLGTYGEVRAVRVELFDVERREVRVEGLAVEGTWLPLIDEYPSGLSSSWSSQASGAVTAVRLTGKDADDCRLHVWFESWPELTRDLSVTASSAHPWHPSYVLLGEQISRIWRAAEGDDAPALTVEVPPDSQPALLELVGVGSVPRVEVSAEGLWREVPVELAGVGPRVRCHLAHDVRTIRITQARQLRAVRVFGTPGGLAGDLTSDAQLKASSHAHGHEPRHVLSPSVDSWRPAADDPHPTLTLDLGRRCVVSSVVVDVTEDGETTPVVEGSSDNHRWTPLDENAHVRQLRVTGSTGVDRLRVRGHGSPQRSAWWERGTPVARYFPKQYDVRFDALSTALPEMQQRGFRVIEIAGIKQGPPSAFAGLGATDNFAVDDRLGTMGDFHQFTRHAGELSLKVIGFDNLGYAHRTAPAFRAAAARVAADPEADGYPFLLARSSLGERWHTDPESGVWYYAYWGEDLPSYDWHRLQWREQSAKILRYWVSQGLDGVGIDAPRDPGGDLDAERRYIGEELTAAGVWSFAEGIPAVADSGPQTAWQRMVVEQRFSAVLDLSISVWHDPAANQLVPAIQREDPSGLETLLRNGRDAVAEVGGVIMEAPAWEADLLGEGAVPAPQRLLEIALLATCGSMFYLTNGLHTYRPEVDVVPTWSAAEQQSLEDILGAVGSEAPLGPAGLRLALPTVDPHHVAWLRTDGSGLLMAIVVFSFSTEPTEARVDISQAVLTELGPDLLGNADPAASLVADTLRLELPARGFAAFGVR